MSSFRLLKNLLAMNTCDFTLNLPLPNYHKKATLSDREEMCVDSDVFDTSMFKCFGTLMFDVLYIDGKWKIFFKYRCFQKCLLLLLGESGMGAECRGRDLPTCVVLPDTSGFLVRT